jgi:beta-alanine--pyruvate transaminase
LIILNINGSIRCKLAQSVDFIYHLRNSQETPMTAALDAYWMPFTANRHFKHAPPARPRPRACITGRPTVARSSTASPGLWCVNAGHSRPEITAAVAKPDRADGLRAAVPDGPPAAFELREKVAADRAAGLNRVFFTNSGSEAVDTALKMALAYHRARGEAARTRLIGRERGYHGVGFGGISVGGMVAQPQDVVGPLLPGRRSSPHTTTSRECLLARRARAWRRARDELEQPGGAARCLDHRGRHRRAGRGLGGVLLPPKGYLERLKETARDLRPNTEAVFSPDLFTTTP